MKYICKPKRALHMVAGHGDCVLRCGLLGGGEGVCPIRADL